MDSSFLSRQAQARLERVVAAYSQYPALRQVNEISSGKFNQPYFLPDF